MPFASRKIFNECVTTSRARAAAAGVEKEGAASQSADSGERNPEFCRRSVSLLKILRSNQPTMSSFTSTLVSFTVLLCGIWFSLDIPSASAFSVAQCKPEEARELPIQLQRICTALHILGDYADVMEEAMNLQTREASSRPHYGEGMGVKRHDKLEHMFMRIGKRSSSDMEV
ncbi:unnamed protein product [Cyprideis torosa]|uniref:Uncharacterized protein n=1 Tax=Cyprideis torosa TaxID=163714 RepID=A0A7R8ZUX4_9CRUS|nr:unnamed protein product [Cyprideis torosa]CAG0901738.1 unnamed protein product [Cyprideis torosa]